VKCTGTARCFQAITGHYFQGMLTQRSAVGGEQDVAVSLCKSESVYEHVFEIIFDLKRFSFGRTGESWRIKDDHVEFFTFPYQTR